MLSKLFTSKQAKEKIDRSTTQVLELVEQKKRLEIDRDQIQLELQNLQKKKDMQLEEEAHKHKLRIQEEQAVFSREKKVWEIEKQELLDRSKREQREFEDRLKKDYDIKIQETVTLTKLESQQLVKQAELDKNREVNELRTKSSEEISKVRTELAEEYYNKLTTAFQEIQLKGDVNSRFVQDLALKMFDKVPTSESRFAVDINTNKQLESSLKQ